MDILQLSPNEQTKKNQLLDKSNIVNMLIELGVSSKEVAEMDAMCLFALCKWEALEANDVTPQILFEDFQEWLCEMDSYRDLQRKIQVSIVLPFKQLFFLY